MKFEFKFEIVKMNKNVHTSNENTRTFLPQKDTFTQYILYEFEAIYTSA